MAHEVEMCNGAAVCRKLTTGVMCPSFMATREEEHSTRGRANLLRSALSGLLPPTELTSPRMYQAMALCVSCKGCKAECPSSVDMAKLKTEFLAHYYSTRTDGRHTTSLINIDRLSRLSSGWRAPIVNWGLSLGLSKHILDRAFGISRERRAALRAAPFYAHRGRQPRPGGGCQRVLLFVDTYNGYCYPQVAKAAAEVLQAPGKRVLLAPVTDTGRPALSKGDVHRARRTALTVVAALESHARMGTPIIFLEPSDWSAVIDDYARAAARGPPSDRCDGPVLYF